MTLKTFPNILVPIIKPTLRNANFGPNNFVKPNDTNTNKEIAINIKSILFLTA